MNATNRKMTKIDILRQLIELMRQDDFTQAFAEHKLGIDMDKVKRGVIDVTKDRLQLEKLNAVYVVAMKSPRDRTGIELDLWKQNGKPDGSELGSQISQIGRRIDLADKHNAVVNAYQHTAAVQFALQAGFKGNLNPNRVKQMLQSAEQKRQAARSTDRLDPRENGVNLNHCEVSDLVDYFEEMLRLPKKHGNMLIRVYEVLNDRLHSVYLDVNGMNKDELIALKRWLDLARAFNPHNTQVNTALQRAEYRLDRLNGKSERVPGGKRKSRKRRKSKGSGSASPKPSRPKKDFNQMSTSQLMNEWYEVYSGGEIDKSNSFLVALGLTIANRRPEQRFEQMSFEDLEFEIARLKVVVLFHPSAQSVLDAAIRIHENGGTNMQFGDASARNSGKGRDKSAARARSQKELERRQNLNPGFGKSWQPDGKVGKSKKR